MGQNYFNTLPLRLQLQNWANAALWTLRIRRWRRQAEGKKIVIVGCGAQGLNQGLNLRDSGWTFPTPCAKPPLSRSASPGRTPLKTALP